MACCFWPEQVEQGVSALTLRRTRSRRIHAGAASARTAARFCIWLERKGGRCCTAPLRRAGRLTSWPCPAFMESVKQAQAGSGPAHGVPVPEGHPAPHKKQPRFCGQGCLFVSSETMLCISSTVFLVSWARCIVTATRGTLSVSDFKRVPALVCLIVFHFGRASVSVRHGDYSTSIMCVAIISAMWTHRASGQLSYTLLRVSQSCCPV